MTTKMVTRLRIIDSVLQAASALEAQPRAIDRYIDYFGDGRARRPDTLAAR